MRNMWLRRKLGTQPQGWRVGAAFGLATLTLAAALAVGGAQGASASSSSIPSGPIKLGALLTMSGPFAAYGTAQELSDNIEVADLNAAGGIDGHKVQLVVKNDGGDPTTAVQQAEALVHSGVDGIVYAGTAATEFQTIPVFMKAKMPVVMLDPDDHWDNGKAYPYMFDDYPENKPTLKYMASFAKEAGITKLAIIDDSSTFATTLEADFNPAAKAIGLPITTSVSYSPTSVDVTTQVRQLKASGANGVAVFAEGGLQYVWTAMKEIGWSPKIVTTAAAYSVGFSALGTLAANAYANCGVALEPGQTSIPGQTKLMNQVESKTIVSPGTSTPLNGNDVFLIFKKAIQTAHSVNGTAIRNAIEQIHNESFTSPEYKYTFTTTQHDGWPASKISMCSLAKFGPGDLPIIAKP